MARRLTRGGRVSPLYAGLGPRLADALRFTTGDRPEAERMLADWEWWRDEYREAWLAGDDVPDPPHHETLARGFARPG